MTGLTKNIILLILFIINFVFALHVVGQEVTDNEEITVVAPYQPNVSEAMKISVSPRIPEEKLEKPAFNYNILAKEFKAVPELDPIVPAKIQGESVSKLYKNYVRAGFGNYTTPYIEFFANKLRSKKNAFGVRVKHLSSSGKITDYAYPGNSITEVDTYGKKFMKSHTLTTEVFYKRQGVHFYGYKPNDYPEISLEKKDIKQNFDRLGFNTILASNYSGKTSVNHSFTLGYSLLNEKYRKPEHNIRFKGEVDKNMEFFKFSQREKLGIDFGVDYFLESDSLPKQNMGIIDFTPFYSLGFDQYYFKIGFNTAIASDSSTKVHVYPIVRAEIKVVKDYLITYVGLFGKIENNSLHSFSAENPFINPYLEKRFTNNKFSQYGGIKGKLSRFMDYNLMFMHSTIQGMSFFVNDTLNADGLELNNQFTVIYDDVKYSRVIAEFGFHFSDNINVMLRGQYNDYFLDNEDYAWHKPKLEISLAADYNMQDKIIVRGELFTRSKMYAKVYEMNNDLGIYKPHTETLDAVVDLNLGLEYRYSKVLSGFLNLNNILNQRYYQWYNYPSYKFNFLIGVTYSF